MKREAWVLAGVMGSVHFAFHFLMRIVPPLIPILALELGLPLWKLGLLLSVYFTGSFIGLLPAGFLSDAYDRRTLLTGGIGLLSFSYLGFGFAPTLGALVPQVSILGYSAQGTIVVMNLAMFVAGLGSSVHVPVGVPIITANAEKGSRGTILGIWGGASKVGDAATPAIIGLLIISFSWDDIVLWLALFGLLYTLVLFVILGFDWFDTVPVGEAVRAHTSSKENGVGDHDRRSYLYPMAALVIYFAGYQIAVQGVVTFTPTFVTDVYAYSFTFAGVYFAPESFADFALSILLIAGGLSRFGIGVLADVYDNRHIMVGTMALATVLLGVLSFTHLHSIALLLVLALFGGSFWGNSPARDSLISDLSPDAEEGRTFGYLWTGSRVFAAISPALVGFIADTAGIQAGFGYLTGAVLLSTLAALSLYSDRVYVTASG